MENAEIYILLSRYFNDECTLEEIIFIREWCNESPENKQKFIRLKKAWIVSNKKNDETITLSAPRVWMNILNDISEKVPKTYTRRTLIYYMAISAVAALIVAFSFTALINGSMFDNTPQYTSFHMPKGEKGEIFLPDGTKVWLNADTRLTLGNDFNARNRTIKLEGEAFFDVAKSDKYNFTVQTSSVDVKVYGTTFNVSAYPDSENIDVTLQKGSVGIYKKDSDEELAVLSPNQHISVNKSTHHSEIDSLDDDTDIAWTFEELIFDYTPLKEMLAKMENWYGVNISILSPPTQEDLKYRFKIKSESLREILELVNKITPVEYEIDGKEVYIRYK